MSGGRSRRRHQAAHDVNENRIHDSAKAEQEAPLADGSCAGQRGRCRFHSGGPMPSPRLTLILGVLLLAVTPPAIAQEVVAPPDSARAQVRAVLRAFYLNLANQNWDALAAYVLSPKLLERRGGPGELRMVARDRTRRRGSPPALAAPRTCPSSASPMIDEAAIRLD